MQVIRMDIPDVLLFEPRVFTDTRGRFLELWNAERYPALGLTTSFVQDNMSVSGAGVLRGLHFQNPHAQGKLVTVVRGAAFDVAVDIRVGSPTFGKFVTALISAENARQLYIPPGFAHGFLSLEDQTTFMYKCTAPYAPHAERTLLWNDPALGISWPHDGPVLSEKDARGLRLQDFAPEDLPHYEPETPLHAVSG
jgi:dTDP-4-dehydrorhamnose 3,5-epimerase